MDTYPQSAASRTLESRKLLWRHRCLFLFFLFLLPVVYLSYQALLDQGSSILPFEREAKWVFHPVQTIKDAFHRPVSKPVRFQLKFWQEMAPGANDSCTLRLRAFRSVTQLRLNDTVVPLETADSWRQPLTVGLASWLRKGENTLELVVANSEGIPGLMVEGPAFLRTPGNWMSMLELEDPSPRMVVNAAQNGPPEPLDQSVGEDPGPLNLWLCEMQLSGLIWAWLILWGGVTFLAAIQLWRGKLTETERKPARLGIYAVIAGLLILGLGLLLGIKNASNFPPGRSPFDFHQHVEYIDYVSRIAWVANPTEGFQMYQPPLYYWIASFLRGGGIESSLKPVQALGALSGWTLALISWLMCSRLMPTNSISWLGAVLFAVCLPMVLYMSPVITNEVFSAALIAVAIYWLVRAAEDYGSVPKVLLAGILVGLAMLSKYPAVFVAVAGSLWFVQQWSVRRNQVSRRAVFIYAGTLILVCGWFYMRNLVQYGDPFIKPGDEASGFWYVQQPTYRTAAFYYSVGSALHHHPERAPWISFVDGHYASFWGDLFRTFLRVDDEQAFFWLGVVLLAAFPASNAILLGLLNSLHSCWRRPVGNIQLLLLAIPVWTFLALVSYSIELPFVSVIKAFFFLYLVPILAFHFVQGRVLIYRAHRSIGWIHDAAFLMVCGISVWLYSYPA